MKNDIMKKSLTHRNFEGAKVRADLEANRECQLWSDETELNHLDFSETPPTPQYQKCDPFKLSAGLINFLKSFRP